jgi:NadR type nicotinamide-nucleotide adenylyltransferase
MRPRHGLVIGKFYPPHAGHRLLVRTAASVSARVTVIVMASSIESIPLAVRVRWLREIHADDPNVSVAGIVDDVPMDFHDDTIWAAHVALMVEAAHGVTAEPVDCVFSSEHYGDELGRRLGARHVAVDPARQLLPISSTVARTNPSRAWEYLAPCVRADLVRRVVLVGAESTGKTTLASELAQALRQRGGSFASTQWVAEHGRAYTLEKLAISRAAAQLQGSAEPGMDSLDWVSDDFVRIARAQNSQEHAAARVGGPVLVCDTDAFATGLWHARYLGNYHPGVDAQALPASGRLYLLTHPDDVPFVQDGLRDGQAVRHWMTDAFVSRLDATGLNWQWLRGRERAARAAAALAATDAFLSTGLGLASPLTATTRDDDAK